MPLLRERPITRIFSALLGCLLILGPVGSPFIHENQMAELLNADLLLLLEVAALYSSCFLFGLLLLFVAWKGRIPKWLARL